MATGALHYSESNLIGVLDRKVSTTDTTIYARFKDAVTGDARTPNAENLLFVIDKGQTGLPNENYEIIEASSHSTASGLTTITVSKRGCSFASSALTAGTGKEHSAGSEIGVADIHYYLTHIARMLAGTDTIPFTLSLVSSNIPIFDTDPTLSDDKQVCTKKYADDLAIAGAPDASATVKGLGEIATDAELAAGTAAGGGGTTADLIAHAASFNVTPTASKVPVANASGLLADGWLGLTTQGDTLYSDGTDLKRLAKGTGNYYYKMNAGATAPEWGGANLEEANTFFGASDISGAEAETLTDGSNADSLHIHRYGKWIDSFTSDVTVASSVTETTITTVTIPANTLGTKNILHSRLFVYNFGLTNTKTATLKFKYGGTTMCTMVILANADTTQQGGYIDFYLQGAGTTASQNGSMRVDFFHADGNAFAGSIATDVTQGFYGNASATEDSTGALALTITIQFNNSSANDYIEVRHGFIHLIPSA